jgi:hypothetical protein
MSGSQTASDVAQSLKLEFPSVDMAVRLVQTPIQLRRGNIDGVVGDVLWEIGISFAWRPECRIESTR